MINGMHECTACYISLAPGNNSVTRDVNRSYCLISVVSRYQFDISVEVEPPPIFTALRNALKLPTSMQQR
jgi:hypothetical protein